MTLNTNLQNLATVIATDVKKINTLINGNVLDLSSLNTAQKNNLVAAINELKSTIDTLPSNASVTSQVNAAIAALVDSAPEALNTLKELADANADVLIALGNRVRVDAAQTFTLTQKNQACDNIGAAKSADIGATDTDFVAIYNTAKV